MLEGRYITLRDGKDVRGPVVYWMSRDQRAEDNWALLFAQWLAIRRKVPLIAIFCLSSGFLNAAVRQYGFMLRGLKEVEGALEAKNIPFFLLKGDPAHEVAAFVKRCKVSELVTDFDPLKIKRSWKGAVSAAIGIPFYEVDAHNIVPCRIASSRQEYAAYTFRPKIQVRLSAWLGDFPELRKHPHGAGLKAVFDLEKTLKALPVDRAVPEVDWLKPGGAEARKALGRFIKLKLGSYAGDRNDPAKDGQSNLSPYLHFGQLSAQRAALEVARSGAGEEGKRAFLEELVVRRELSDNFCHYNSDYDNVKGFPAWAVKTLEEHAADRREFIYSLEEFEKAATDDQLWNAAQSEMVKSGKMHGYMRMYWAKKILEWSGTASGALETAIYLNDRYELDGRDPNGYTGIAWSIGGVHDRAWGERAVFGKVRYMSHKGCRSKFDVDRYVNRWLG